MGHDAQVDLFDGDIDHATQRKWVVGIVIATLMALAIGLVGAT